MTTCLQVNQKSLVLTLKIRDLFTLMVSDLELDNGDSMTVWTCGSWDRRAIMLNTTRIFMISNLGQDLISLNSLTLRLRIRKAILKQLTSGYFRKIRQRRDFLSWRLPSLSSTYTQMLLIQRQIDFSEQWCGLLLTKSLENMLFWIFHETTATAIIKLPNGSFCLYDKNDLL